MATRSTIAKLNPDGTVTSIYCHWDGYPDGVGATLLEHYTDSAKVDQLLALGDLSILDNEIGEKQDFDNRTKGWTLAYGRDRGETGIYALPHMDVDGWKALRRDSGCEYGYLWNGVWWETFDLYGVDENE
jgi:hypothetical protein